jgi:hypothetical protein
MRVNEILASIDAEISTLQQARALLIRTEPNGPRAKASSKKTLKKKRILSPEAIARIAEGQRKRWAAQRKAAK